MIKHWLLGLFCAMLSGTALAAGPGPQREDVQGSMVVTGSITVTPEGKVKSFVIDRAGRLPPSVVDLIGKNAPNWGFEPVVRDGVSVFAKADMNLRIVAKPLGGKTYALSISGSYFGKPSSGSKPDVGIAIKRQDPPTYPVEPGQPIISGTVFVALRVNRQGRVDADVAEQVNLDAPGTDAQMKRWRKMLADAALSAARRWTFTPPTSGPEADDASWVVRVPVTFRTGRDDNLNAARSYGKWHAYVPGPHNVPAWLAESESAASPDAVAAGRVAEVGGGLRLTTPLDGV